MRNFAEEANTFVLVLPVDLGGQANPSIGRVNMAQYDHAEICIIKAAGTAAEPVVVTVIQSNAASGGSSKALTLRNGIYVKTHANIEDATAFAKEAEDSAGVYTATSAIAKEGIIKIPINSEDLDNENGYHWFSASIADTGVANLGVMYVDVFGARYTPPPDAF